jgi:hypothetical protein
MMSFGECEDSSPFALEMLREDMRATCADPGVIRLASPSPPADSAVGGAWGAGGAGAPLA